MEHLNANVAALTNHVAGRVGRDLNDREQVIVLNWANEYGFDSDLIDQVLDEGLSRGITDFVYFGAIARNWYQWGVKSADEARKYRGTKALPIMTSALQVRGSALTLESMAQAFEAMVSQVRVLTDRVNALEGRVRNIEQSHQQLIRDAQDAFKSVDGEFATVRSLFEKYSDAILTTKEDLRKLRTDLGG